MAVNLHGRPAPSAAADVWRFFASPQFLAIVVGIFIILPMLIVVVMSFGTDRTFQFPPRTYSWGSYQRYFSESRWLIPTLNSVIIGVGTMVLTMVLAVPAALAFAQDRFRGQALVRLLLVAPLMVPHIVLALAYFAFFAKIGLLRSHLGVIIAHTAVSAPVVFLIVTANLKNFDWTLVRASASLGAPPLTTFRQVMFPLLRPGFLVAALFAFIHSFDEAVIAIFISGRQASTLPRRMFESVREESDPVVAVVSALIFAIVAIGATAALVVKQRRQAALAAAKGRA